MNPIRHSLAYTPLLLLLMVVGVVGGCTLTGPGGRADLTDLEEARLLWHRQGLDDYDMKMQRSCFCVGAGSLTVYVRGDSVAAVTQDERFWPSNDDWWQYIPTVQELFELIEQASTEAASLEVRYHPEMGYPTEVTIDWLADAVDDEIWYAVSQVTPSDTAILRLAPDQLVTLAPGLSIAFESVDEDSRCAYNVECIWAGRAAITIRVTRQGLVDRIQLMDGSLRDGESNTAQIGPVTITLAGVSPYPADAGVPIPVSEYRAFLLVSLS